MTNYVKQEVKQSKILELSDLLEQVSRTLEKVTLGIDISEYEKQLISNNYHDWIRIQSILKEYEIAEDIYEDFLQFPKHYKIVGNEILYNTNWKAEAIRKEKERIANLTLTSADVERAIYKAKGMDFNDILELIKDNPTIDLKALRIELKANNFYRGNPYVEQIGTLLGYTSNELDYLFENKELPKK